MAEYCSRHEAKCRNNVRQQHSTSIDDGSAVAESNKKENQIHDVEKLYKCANCSEKFRTKSALRKHFDKHKRVTLHTCNVCDKEFPTSYGVKSHKKDHSKQTPFKCEQCGRGFKQKSNLKAHIIRHATREKTLKCTECNRAFYNQKT